jgi:HSP90 family molecular chaperone
MGMNDVDIFNNLGMIAKSGTKVHFQSPKKSPKQCHFTDMLVGFHGST